MRLIDADALLKYEIEADRMGAMLVVGKGHILSAPTIKDRQNPWVRTADRLPEGKDAFEDKVLVYNFVERRQQLKLWLIVRTYPHVFPYWMPIPPLPEVEG